MNKKRVKLKIYTPKGILMMELADFLQVEEYRTDAYQKFGSFKLLESYIRLSRGDASVKVLDPRFEKDYTWKDLHACADLRLELWCLKPTDSKTHKRLQHAVHIIGRPATCLLDFGVGFTITTAKTIIAAHNLLFAIGSKIILPFRDAHFRDVGDDFMSFCSSFEYCFNSLLEVIVRAFTIVFLVHFIGPGRINLFSYTVKNLETKEYETILDISRVEFIRKKCGWEDVSDKAFKELGSQFSCEGRGPMELSYREENGRYRVMAEFEITVSGEHFSHTKHYKLNNVNLYTPNPWLESIKQKVLEKVAL